MIRNRIPDVVIQRLATYLRILRDPSLATKGYISSAELGDLATVNSAQVRKDLALFGEFGKQGVGYPVSRLRDELIRILGADREMGVAIFGVGELGTALARFLLARRKEIPNYRFVLRALIDKDPLKIGTYIGEMEIKSLDQIDNLEIQRLKIGIITVPASEAQEVVDLAVSKGIKGFLTFAPVKLKAPPDVRVQYSDVTLSLQELAFYL